MDQVINYKNIHGETILHHLIRYDHPLPVIKLNFEYYLKHCPGIFYEESRNFNTLFIEAFHDYGHYGCDFRTLKYIIEFYKKNFPEEFMCMSPLTHSISYLSLRYIKYLFKIYIKTCPYSFIKDKKYFKEFKHDHFSIIHESEIIKCVLKFLNYNYPEIVDSTNNFILPLMMEIQN